MSKNETDFNIDIVYQGILLEILY